MHKRKMTVRDDVRSIFTLKEVNMQMTVAGTRQIHSLGEDRLLPPHFSFFGFACFFCSQNT